MSAGEAGPSDEGAASGQELPPWLFPALFAVACVALFWPILQVRGHQYMNRPEWSHCLLLPVVSGLWAWERLDRLKTIPRNVSGLGIALLAFGIVLYLGGRVVSKNLFQHVGMLTALVGLIWGFAGWRLTRALAFPLGYLFLTIPLPNPWTEAIIQPLQRGATVTAEWAFHALGWVVVRQGNVLQLPGIKLLVEEACSGVHSLFALLSLAVAWVFFVDRPVWMRWTLVIAAVPIAVIANAIRVIGTGVLAHKVDPSWAKGTSHEVAGMIVFAIGVTLLLSVDWCIKPDYVYEDDDVEAPAGTGQPADGGDADGS